MEVQISNNAHCVLTLDNLKFDASELLAITDLNRVQSKFVFGDQLTLYVGDTRQYLYLLQAAVIDDLIAFSTSSLGKLDIGWKTNMGQSGRLQTAALSRKVNHQDQFDIKVIRIPPRISVEVPFQLECQIFNYGDTGRISISGIKSKMGSVLLSGSGEIKLGSILSSKSCTVILAFFPLYSGLHRISGLRLSDAISGCVQDIDHLTDVFVLDLESNSEPIS